MFAFYAKLEHSCPNVAQCPHLGGAAIASLVHVANHSLQTEENCLRQIRVLEKENAELLSKVDQEKVSGTNGVVHGLFMVLAVEALLSVQHSRTRGFALRFS